MAKENEKGFTIARNLISTQKANELVLIAKSKISEFAHELNVPMAEYLRCTGRWGTNSSITKALSSKLDYQIQNYIEKYYDIRISQKKSNVICKTADLIDKVPFHQDISYSVNDPYHFSVWLSLNDISDNAGAVQCIEGSHRLPIKPAIDFWYPYFTDKVANQNTDRHYFYCSAGDAFIFDSKLWHGSDENHVGTDRFAYVTRWVIEGKGFPEIPAIKPAAFGMFNCGNLTQEIMKKALSLFDLELEKTATNKGELITIWLDILAKSPNIWGVDSHTATRDLKNLHILNNAYELHDAGNISGGVYKDLWFSLLSSLNNKIQLIEAMEHKN
ncbi:MAG: phytanoyl-CoA dioxygenase family protein [Rickettsiaceae bacterium]|jgi:ectoine hydroxylase-related dioxygenase (phytanoyl-CoA dioxygenase family)|nr:phytanoyl-CoA dioxygenase family protein [Rickettsiaceae bacterium]